MSAASTRSPAPADLRRLVETVKRVIAGLPAIDTDRLASYEEHRVAARTALDGLAREHGLTWRQAGGEIRLALGGVRAQSTMGVAMALVNWTVAAERRAIRAAGGGHGVS